MSKSTFYEILLAAAILVIVVIIGMAGASDETYEEDANGDPVPSLTMSELQQPGMKIAILTGSELNDTMERFFPDAQKLEYEVFADVFNAVDTGKADAALGFNDHINMVPQSYPGITHVRDKVTDYSYGFATQKNRAGKKLCNEMNQYFHELVASGEFDKLNQKWQESNGEQVMDEYTFTGEKGKLRVAALGTWSPMSFYSGETLTGEFIELMNGFCESAGYVPEYESMPYTSEIAGLNAGQYDVIADNIARTEERLESVNITDPLFSDQVYAFVPAKTAGEGISGPKAFVHSLKNSFIKTFLTESRWRMLLSGLGITLALSALAGVFGTALGALICFLRMRRSEFPQAVANLYIRVFRGIPIVVLLLVLNYLIFTGRNFPAFWVCVVGFSLDFAAYASEIFRSGIESVPAGQARAAKALGFGNLHGFRRVVLPQALIYILPVYTGQLIATVKITSVAGYISVMDLTRASDLIRSRTYEAFFPLIVTALIYFLLCMLLIIVLRHLEKRIQPGTRRIERLQELMLREGAGFGNGSTAGSAATQAGAQAPGSSGSTTGEDAPAFANEDAPAFAGERASREHGSTGETEGRRILYQVSHLRKSYENVTPVKDMSCEIREGDVISVIGPSGTGKSTFLNLLNQLEQADDGEIRYRGEDILAKGYDLNGLRRRVGMVFQSFNLFPHLTIVENVMLAQEELLQRTREEAFRHSMEMLEKVGLEQKALNYPQELSGGQQQRVAIARAIAMDPEMILFDEPTSALDPTTIGEVLAVIRRLARNGMTMIAVTHEMNFARDVSSRVFYLDEGVIYEEGTPEQIFTEPRGDRTRRFIFKIRSWEWNLSTAGIDMFGLLGSLEEFCGRQYMGKHAANDCQLAVEELIAAYLQPTLQGATTAGPETTETTALTSQGTGPQAGSMPCIRLLVNAGEEGREMTLVVDTTGMPEGCPLPGDGSDPFSTDRAKAGADAPDAPDTPDTPDTPDAPDALSNAILASVLIRMPDPEPGIAVFRIRQ